jgi:hypothetical protein
VLVAPTGVSIHKKDPRAVGAARGSREERVLLLPAGYEAGRLSRGGPSPDRAG